MNLNYLAHLTTQFCYSVYFLLFACCFDNYEHAQWLLCSHGETSNVQAFIILSLIKYYIIPVGNSRMSPIVTASVKFPYSLILLLPSYSHSFLFSVLSEFSTSTPSFSGLSYI